MSETNHVIRVADCRDLRFLEFPHGCSVFLLPTRPTFIKTSVTGRWIYERLREQPATLDDIIRDTARHYELPEQRVRPSVTALIEELCHSGLAVRGSSAVHVAPVRSLDDMILQQVWMNITNLCNLGCAYCFVPDTNVNGHHMEIDLARKVIDEAAHLGAVHVVLSGGEPTLHPGLRQIVEHAATKQGMMLKLVTNGTRTDREFFAPLIPAIGDIQVSVDGTDEATHDALRGKGSFSRITGLFRTLGQHFPTVSRGLSFTPLPANVHQLPQLYKLALTFGATYIHLNRPKLAGRPNAGTPYRSDVFLGNGFFQRALAGFDELLGNILRDTELNQGFEGRARAALDTSFDPASELFDRLRKPRCAAGSLTMCVNQDGECFPCAALCRPGLSAGNVRETRLASLYARLRKHAERSFHVDRDPACAGCDFRYFCGGGCRANNDDLGARDPMCTLLQERYTSVLANIPNPRKFQPDVPSGGQGGAPAAAGFRPACG